jgi:hypothetical protein
MPTAPDAKADALARQSEIGCIEVGRHLMPLLGRRRESRLERRMLLQLSHSLGREAQL